MLLLALLQYEGLPGKLSCSGVGKIEDSRIRLHMGERYDVVAIAAAVKNTRVFSAILTAVALEYLRMAG